MKIHPICFQPHQRNNNYSKQPQQVSFKEFYGADEFAMSSMTAEQEQYAYNIAQKLQNFDIKIVQKEPGLNFPYPACMIKTVGDTKLRLSGKYDTESIKSWTTVDGASFADPSSSGGIENSYFYLSNGKTYAPTTREPIYPPYIPYSNGHWAIKSFLKELAYLDKLDSIISAKKQVNKNNTKSDRVIVNYTYKN